MSYQRVATPFLVGYSWELLIGLCVLTFGLGKGALTGKGIQAVSLKTFQSILVAAAPTALGTGFFMYALSIGPLGLVSALLSTSMVFTLIFGAYLYNERFGVRQVGLLIVITALIFGLKLVSPV